MKLQTLQILQIFIECRNIVGGASVHGMCGVRVVSMYVYVYVYVWCVC